MRRDTLWLLAIVAGAIALRLVFFTGVIFYDDTFYLARAVELGRGAWVPPSDAFGARLGLVGPVAVAIRLFGVSDASLAAWPFVCSISAVVVAAVLGRRLFGARTGLLAALLVALYPLDILGASSLSANTIQTLFSGTALGLFLLGDRERRPSLHLLAGLCLGVGTLAHELTVFALLFYPVYLLGPGRASRHHLWVLAGMAAVGLLDPLIHASMGDPLARLHQLLTVGTVKGNSPDVAYLGFNLQWIAEPFWRSATEQELGIYAILVGPLAVWRAIRPSSPLERAVALFILAVALWTFYGTVTPLHYAPLARVPRYLASLTLPAVWLLGHELAERRGPRLRAAVLGVIALTSLACVAVDGGRTRRVPGVLVRDALAELGPSRVVVERHLYPKLELAEGYAPAYTLERLRKDTPLGGALVVVSEDAPRALLAATPGARRVSVVVPPRSIYQRVLASKPVLGLLRLTRPAYRFEDLERKINPEPIEIYRVP